MDLDDDPTRQPNNRPSATTLSTPEISNIGDNSQLERCGRWLLSIPRDDIRLLQETPEYHAFLQSFERLGHAHRHTVILNQTLSSSPSPSDTTAPYSFLQHLAVDDVILRVFEFLECEALVKTSTTCHRFRNLALRSAEQRTQHMRFPSSSSSSRCRSSSSSDLERFYRGDDHGDANQYFIFCHHPTAANSPGYLGSAMRMLRAKEQMEGIRPDRPPFVCVPILGLYRRICVSRSGDPEYNGIYFCTGSNGNGFVFTKPRFLERRRLRCHTNGIENGLDPNVATAATAEEEREGYLLRCIISKRFSNETILWYMSKEIETTPGSTANATPNQPYPIQITQVFSFWAKLMLIGEAPQDVSRYPSQTSILSRNGQPGWQSLPNTRSVNPPVVELLD